MLSPSKLNKHLTHDPIISTNYIIKPKPCKHRKLSKTRFMDTINIILSANYQCAAGGHAIIDRLLVSN